MSEPSTLHGDLLQELEWWKNAAAIGQPVYVDTLLTALEQAIDERDEARQSLREIEDDDKPVSDMQLVLLDVRRILRGSKVSALKGAVSEALKVVDKALE